MNFFTGKFRHSIDDKGRLIVPSRVRDQLEDGRVFLTVWTDQCISLWSGDGLRRLHDQLLSQDKSSTEAWRFNRMMATEGHMGEVDKQGRISIPQSLRDFAGIDRDVVIAGVVDHAEIWNPERHEEEERKQRERPVEEQIRELKF